MFDEIAKHVQSYFKDERYKYHSWRHTQEVHDAAFEIAEKEGLSEEVVELIRIAAYFHDTGYSEDAQNHEEISASIAQDYLSKKDYPKEKVDTVKRIILATKMSVEPSDIAERVIKDADLSHMGRLNYDHYADSLRKEKEVVQGISYTDEDWAEINKGFIQNNKWYTKAAKELYNDQRKATIKRLKSEVKSKKKKQDQNIPTRGIETMYRVALRNHNQLSKIADNKANILLSITALMLSILISALAPKIDSNTYLAIPTFMIITVCLITMVFAILATRPKVSSAKYSRERLLNNEINLLFFGNFYNISVDEFEWGMNQLMNDKDLLYGSLSKDLYYLGKVLAKKYKYLQTAYAIFMIGLVISTIAFVITLSVSM